VSLSGARPEHLKRGGEGSSRLMDSKAANRAAARKEEYSKKTKPFLNGSSGGIVEATKKSPSSSFPELGSCVMMVCPLGMITDRLVVHRKKNGKSGASRVLKMTLEQKSRAGSPKN